MRVTELRLLRAYFGISATILSCLALAGGVHAPRHNESAFVDVLARQRHIDSMPPGAQRDTARAAWVARQGGIVYGARRVFVGRNQDRASVINLADPLGRVRLRLIVDSLGTAQIQFVDTLGHVQSTLPK